MQLNEELQQAQIKFISHGVWERFFSKFREASGEVLTETVKK